MFVCCLMISAAKVPNVATRQTQNSFSSSLGAATQYAKPWMLVLSQYSRQWLHRMSQKLASPSSSSSSSSPSLSSLSSCPSESPLHSYSVEIKFIEFVNSFTAVEDTGL